MPINLAKPGLRALQCKCKSYWVTNSNDFAALCVPANRQNNHIVR